MRVCASLAVVVVACGAASGQSPDKARFQAAEIRSSPKTSQPIVRGPFSTAGRYELRFATMLDLIRIAYGLDGESVAGGPPWLEMDRFDVFAKTPERPSPQALRQMLQTLLAERFHLAVHHETRPIPAWGLAAKKPQIKQSADEGESGCRFVPQNQQSGPAPAGGPTPLPVYGFVCRNVTMAAFANALLNAPAAGQYLNNRLMIDRTGLKGAYDFTLIYTPTMAAGIATTGEQIPLFDAIERQLGLTVEATTTPMPMTVVDHVDRQPTPNSSEELKSFPPPPTEFEVASLKPMAPDARPGQADIKNGRLYFSGTTLQQLIVLGWDLNGGDYIANAPPWLNEDRFEIIAKAPEGVAIGGAATTRNAVSVNIDALRPMLKSLVIERFQIAAHMEERPRDTYTLVANRPKLKPADPGSRTRWMQGTAPESRGDRNANAALGRLLTFQNVSMAQFADLLPIVAPAYLRTTVVDATLLEGGYDFTLSFSPLGAVRAAQAAPDDSGEAPTSTVSLFDALNRQLGLKLEKVKRPVPMLVIDMIERKPLEN
jgi:uncharacterized protein (TIGR03435 family)